MYKIFDRRTCGLSHQIKGPTTVKLAKTGFNCKIVKFTITGPLIWCDNPQVRLSKILYINNNNFHHLGRSQMCAGGCYVFRTSKPHSGTLCTLLWTSDETQNIVDKYFSRSHQTPDWIFFLSESPPPKTPLKIIFLARNFLCDLIWVLWRILGGIVKKFFFCFFQNFPRVPPLDIFDKIGQKHP